MKCTLLLLTLSIFLVAARANDPSPREQELEQRVQTLEARIATLEQLVDRLAPHEAHEAVEAAPVATPTPDPGVMRAYWRDGVVLETEDKAFRMQVRGRVQNDWFTGDVNHGDLPSGTRFRRAWMGVYGKMYDNIAYQAAYDFAGDGRAKFVDAFIDLPVGAFGNLRLGQFRERLGMENETANIFVPFLERAPSGRILPLRNTGAMLHRSYYGNRLTWAVGAFRITNSFGDGFDDDDVAGKWDAAARITGAPWYEDGGQRLWHLGGSYVRRDWDGDNFRFATRGSYRNGDMLLDTGTFAMDRMDIFTAETALKLGPFMTQAEYNHSRAHGARGVDDGQFNGGFVMLSYFLTGEGHPYGAANWGRVRPTRNVSPANDGWGAWELVARYSHMDVGDTPVSAAPGGRLNDYTAGLNWYLNPNTRFMFQYVRSETDDRQVRDLAANVFHARFQVDF